MKFYREWVNDIPVDLPVSRDVAARAPQLNVLDLRESRIVRFQREFGSPSLEINAALHPDDLHDLRAYVDYRERRSWFNAAMIGFFIAVVVFLSFSYLAQIVK